MLESAVSQSLPNSCRPPSSSISLSRSRQRRLRLCSRNFTTTQTWNALQPLSCKRRRSHRRRHCSRWRAMGSCACASQRRRQSPHAPRWQYTSELLALVGYGVPLTATQSGLLRMGRGIAFRYVRARCTRYASLTLPSPHPTPPPSPPAPLDPHPYLHPHPPSSPPSPSGGGGGPRSGVVGGESARNERC